MDVYIEIAEAIKREVAGIMRKAINKTEYRYKDAGGGFTNWTMVQADINATIDRHLIADEPATRIVKTSASGKSCKDCKHDSRHYCCTHPDEQKPGFWEDQREVDGRNWCWTVEGGETRKLKTNDGEE